MNIQTWLQSHRRIVLINAVLFLLLISAIVYYLSLFPKPSADTISTILNTANAKGCLTGEPITICDPANGKYSITAASNTVSTTVTLVSPVPTATVTATTTTTPTATSMPSATSFSIPTVSVSVSRNSATLRWTTTTASTGKVSYGTSSTSLTESSSTTPSGTSHQVNLSGLKRKTNYYYKIIATTSTGSIAEKTGYFRTK